MSVQVIMKEGRPEWAVMPYAEYEALLAKLESLENGARHDRNHLNASGVKSEQVISDMAAVSAQAQPPLSKRESLEPQDRKALRNNLMEQLKLAGQVAEAGKFDGARMTVLRKQKGMDDAYIAREIGISPVYLKQIEDGERQPSEPILRNIARALGVDISELST